MYTYQSQEQVNILQRMAQLSEAMQQFEFADQEDANQYKVYSKMLEELENILIELRDSQQQERQK